MDESKLIVSKVLKDIINGYSKIKIDNTEIYVMHLSPLQEGEIEEYKIEKFKEAIKRGLFSEKDKLDLLKKENLWKEEDDLELSELHEYLKRLKENLTFLYFPSQKRTQQELINSKEEEYYHKLNFKEELLGLTAEKYAEKKSNNFYLYFCLFKDCLLTERLYDEKSFSLLHDDQIKNLIINFNQVVNLLSDYNIKKTALSSITQKLYNLAGSTFDFMGKHICYFSYYQISLCSYIGYYQSVLNQLDKSISEEQRNDPDKLETLYESSQNINKAKSKIGSNDSKGVALFGATQQDLEELGLKPKEDKMTKLLKEKGSLSMEDMIKYDL